MKRRIIIRVDGSPAVGMGHVVRCLVLAAALRQARIQPIFVTRSADADVLRLLRAHRTDVEIIGPRVSLEAECRVIRDLGRKSQSRAVLLDINNGSTFPDTKSYHAYLKALRSHSLYLATIEGMSNHPFPADLVIIPYVGAEQLKVRRRAATVYLRGTKYFIVGGDFETARREPRKHARNVLITMGGSDPARLTEKAVRALAGTAGDFHIDVLLGQYARRRAPEIRRALREFRGTYQIIRGTRRISRLFKKADVALISSGLTKYETAVSGLPAIAVSPNSEHARIMRTFDKCGAVLHLGEAAKVSEARIADAVSGLMNSHAARVRMSRRGRRLLDTGGAQRIISVLLNTAMKET